MAISLLPASPSRSDDPVNFSIKADAFVAALPTFVTEVNTVASTIDANATVASASSATAITKAAEAAASATAAAGAAGAAKWLAATSYTQGNTAWSPINFQTYRRSLAGSGTTATDPSLDITTWTLVSAGTTPHFILQSLGLL